MLKEILISNSFAQEAAAATNQESTIASFVPLIAIFVIFYFLIIRPQSKKIKEHQQMVNNLKVGDKVVTSGGIVGLVKEVKTNEGEVLVEIAEGVLVNIVKTHIIDLTKKEDKKSKKEDKKSKK